MPPPWDDLIAQSAARYGVSPDWLRAMMAIESEGNPRAESHAGAMGLMQVMPGTYSDLRARHPELGEDPYDPANNIGAGAALIAELAQAYDGDPEAILAAYNGGPLRWSQYSEQGMDLPAETQRYLNVLLPQLDGIPALTTGGLAAGAPAAAAPSPIVPQPQATGGPLPLTTENAQMPPIPDPAAPQGGVIEQLFGRENAMSWLGLGAGLLSAAAPSPNPQNAFAAGVEGWMAGQQADAQRAERERQRQQEATLQAALAGSNLSPEMQALAAAFPERFAAAQFDAMNSGGGGPFGGTGLETSLLNTYVTLGQRIAAGETLTPAEQNAFDVARNRLTMPQTRLGPNGDLIQVTPTLPPLTGGGSGGIAAPMVPPAGGGSGGIAAPMVPPAGGAGVGIAAPLTAPGPGPVTTAPLPPAGVAGAGGRALGATGGVVSGVPTAAGVAEGPVAGAEAPRSTVTTLLEDPSPPGERFAPGEQARYISFGRAVAPLLGLSYAARFPAENQGELDQPNRWAIGATEALGIPMGDVVSTVSELFGGDPVTIDASAVRTIDRALNQNLRRALSGAALTETEVDDFIETFMPSVRDTAASLEVKYRILEAFFNEYERTLAQPLDPNMTREHVSRNLVTAAYADLATQIGVAAMSEMRPPELPAGSEPALRDLEEQYGLEPLR